MKKIRMMMCGGAILCVMAASAVPAKRGVFTIKQPGGEELKVRLVGDERQHYYMTEDYHVLVEENGTFYYADSDGNGGVLNTMIVARNKELRPESDNRLLSGINTEAVGSAMFKRSESAPRRANSYSGIGLYTSNFPTKGDIKALVILVQYRDVAFNTANAYDYFNNMLNEEGFSDYGGTGSARDYFLSASNGQFRPQFDVFGPVTLPQLQSYYGGNDYYGNDKNPEMMVVHAAQLLDDQINFSDYDMDGDGVVDNVYVFYAGQGEASYGGANTVWPHSYELSSATSTPYIFDGVRLNRYACSNEMEQTRPDGVGTFVHEFSHVMGLPDLYHTTSSSAYYTPNEWSVMDYGPYNNDGRTPPTYSVYERNAMGWIDPVEINGAMDIELENIQDSNMGCIIPTSRNNEFFLLENRQQTGWDTYLPGHGMLIWHIDFNQSVWDENVVNNTKSHQYVDIEEANNNPTGTASAMAGYPFPGTGGKTSFTDTTTPSMKTWAGQGLGLPITDIAEVEGKITFKVAGGAPLMGSPVVSQPTQITESSFVANWLPVDGATDYYLTVSTSVDTERSEDYADFGSGAALSMPDGWTGSSSLAYTSSDYSGASAPSCKMSKDSDVLTSATYDIPVSSISFWYRGASASESNSLEVSGFDGETWQTVKKVQPLTNASGGETVEIKKIPDNICQVKIKYNKVSSGNCALDDVRIICGGEAGEIVPGYDGVSTGGKTFMLVDRLIAGVNRYKYTVTATDGSDISDESDPMIVALGDNSGLEHIAGDTAQVSFKVSGLDLEISGADGDAITVFDVVGRAVAGFRPVSGTVHVTLPSSGVYIVTTSRESFKVAVK